MNPAQIKFFSLFISALYKVQIVCFEKLTGSFNSDVKMDLSLRRIQQFMLEYVLDTNPITSFWFLILPHKPPYRLALVRTNWKFGTKSINVLVLAIVYKGVTFPLLFLMMPKFRNSCTLKRIELTTVSFAYLALITSNVSWLAESL